MESRTPMGAPSDCDKIKIVSDLNIMKKKKTELFSRANIILDSVTFVINANEIPFSKCTTAQCSEQWNIHNTSWAFEHSVTSPAKALIAFYH